MFYRIKEIDGDFIPQKLTLFGWFTIDRTDKYLWFRNDYGRENGSFSTLEEAKGRIKEYKIKSKVKYHKVEQ